MKKLTAYFHGICQPNPCGYLGIGASIYRSKKMIYIYSQHVAPSNENTNHTASYLGVINIYQELLRYKHSYSVILRSDQKFVIQQLSGFYGIKRGAYVERAREAQSLQEQLLSKGCKLYFDFSHSEYVGEVKLLAQQAIEDNSDGLSFI